MNWPESPYRMLGFYRDADQPLLAGRDGDIKECAELLDDARTRLLLLHGASACGKSSFLRAGLIPALDSGETVVYVRSTATPLAMLADAVFEIARREVDVFGPEGVRKVSLGIVPDGVDQAGFRKQHAEAPAALLEVLKLLSRRSSRTMVLVVDQGEEVLTVDPGTSGEGPRGWFFEFLAGFLSAGLDAKLIVTLRTEFLGRFVARMRRTARSGVTEYLLDELTEEQMLEAILRPTLREKVADMPPPYHTYRFEFATGVAGIIAAEIARARLVGGRLPALQIVCGTLYELVRDAPRAITLEDYNKVGGITGAIEQFLNGAFERCATAQRLIPTLAATEASRWKAAMCELLREQPDGTVTTDLRPVSEIGDRLRASSLQWDATLASLMEDGILRQVDVIDRGTGELVPCLGLGHDALGLVLRDWRSKQRKVASLVPAEESGVADRGGYTLCLSAGGYRAALFHLGAILRLNEAGFVKKLSVVTSVSCGALVAGILAMNWSKLEFGADGVATNLWEWVAKPLLAVTSQTLDTGSMIRTFLLSPVLGSALEQSLRRELFGEVRLHQLPSTPSTLFVSANLRTRGQVRIWNDHITDSRIGTIWKPDWRLSEAVAASLAMPPALGPFTAATRPASWTPLKGNNLSDLCRPPFTEKMTLVDGAVLDYLAVDAVWRDSNTILVSDASVDAEPDEPVSGWGFEMIGQVVAMLDMNSDQLRAMRRSQAVRALESGSRTGAYWRPVPSDAPWSEGLPAIGGEQLRLLTGVPSRLAELDEPVRERLVNFGYAQCDGGVRARLFSDLPPAAGLPFPKRSWG